MKLSCLSFVCLFLGVATVCCGGAVSTANDPPDAAPNDPPDAALADAPQETIDQPKPRCPPDLTSPIPMVTCTDEREPIDGKISDADRMRFSIAALVNPLGAVIHVRGGAMICELPTCPARPCPIGDSWTQRWKDENLASQRCVRELVAQFTDAVTPANYTDYFLARLTWAQIQEVAAHPHVRAIEDAGDGAPPP